MSSSVAASTDSRDDTSNKNKNRDLKDAKMVVKKATNFLETLAQPIGSAITVLLPIIIAGCAKLYSFYCTLPQNAIDFTIGTLFCFFGGLYPVLFSAIQAAEYGGRQTVIESVRDVANEAIIIIEQSKKDDEIDDDNDGIADVKQISGSQYLRRKGQLVLKKMNPAKVDTALYSMYSVWLSIAAVLKLEFARTIALSLSISKFLKKPCDIFLAPLIQMAVPDEYDQWVPVILGWICKSMAMSIAWYVQSILSAFSSALSGGLIMSQAFYNFTKKYTSTPKKDSANDPFYTIEICSLVFAAMGFYFQYQINFDMPFPFDYILFPFEITEYYLRWTITE